MMGVDLLSIPIDSSLSDTYSWPRNNGDVYYSCEWELLKRNLRDSFYAFCAFFWDSVPGNPSFQNNWHIELICRYLQDCYEGSISPNLIINMPPGHGKSIIGSVLFPVWVWVQEPSFRWLCGSYDKGLATRDSLRCRDVLSNEIYQHLFPLGLKKDQSEKTYYVNDRGGSRYSLSPGSATIGWRAYGRVFDDPHPLKPLYKGDDLTKSILWFSGAMASRLDVRPDGSDPISIVIGQRVDYYDLSGYLQRVRGEYEDVTGAHWDILSIESEYDPSRSFCDLDPRSKEGELLFEGLYPERRLRTIEVSLGSKAYDWQYNQRGTQESGVLVDVKNFEYWSELDELPVFDLVIHSWDCPVVESDKSSNAAGGVWGVVYRDPINEYWLLDQALDKAAIQKNIGMIRRLVRTSQWSPQEIVIEAKANGVPIADTIQGEFGNIVRHEPKGSKAERLVSIKPEIDAGMVKIPNPKRYPWIKGYLKEFREFSGKGDPSDQIDQTTMAIRYLRGRRRLYWSK